MTIGIKYCFCDDNDGDDDDEDDDDYDNGTDKSVIEIKNWGCGADDRFIDSLDNLIIVTVNMFPEHSSLKHEYRNSSK